VTCCYARSEKHWVTDPQGIAWEHFRTLDNIPLFTENATPRAGSTACCAKDAPSDRPVANSLKPASSCC
jgi:lactoylglutathione lyase